MTQPKVIEGTREEIIALLEEPEMAGRKLKLIVLPEEVQASNNRAKSEKEHFYFTATRREFNQALDALAEQNQELPVLPPEAFERESIYEDVP